jgi:hypothetical protein
MSVEHLGQRNLATLGLATRLATAQVSLPLFKNTWGNAPVLTVEK